MLFAAMFILAAVSLYTQTNSDEENYDSVSDLEVQLWLGDFYDANDIYDMAIERYTNVISIDPNYADAYYKRGNAYSRRGNAYSSKEDFDKAIADYNQAIRIKPDDASAYADRSWAYYLKGDNDSAITDADEAIRLRPNYAYAYVTRGYAYLAKKDYDRAIADFETALRIKPDNAIYKAHLELARQAKLRGFWQ
jgi:tetratricopeptide (TPR) repeat protein